MATVLPTDMLESQVMMTLPINITLHLQNITKHLQTAILSSTLPDIAKKYNSLTEHSSMSKNTLDGSGLLVKYFRSIYFTELVFSHAYTRD